MTAPHVPLRESLDQSLSFLVSLVFHLFLLLALALGEFSQKQATSLTVSMAAPEEDVSLLDAHYSNNGASDPTQYWVTVAVQGRSAQTFSGNISSGQEPQVVCRFSVP